MSIHTRLYRSLLFRLASRAVLMTLLVPGSITYSHAETIMLEPQGEYASIDTRLAMQTMKELTQGTDQERVQTIRAVMAAPQNYAPPVFYVLSSLLFEAGLKDDAAFWFYAGQLRARFDANRCNDVSARSAAATLNERYGAPINQYAFQDKVKLETLIEKVVKWDRDTPHNYDHRWINLSGMGATTSAMGGAADATPLSLPETQWAAIAEKTRTDYLAGLREALNKAQ
ncbi:hypothetical protein [Aquamicrobium sp.]|uniref:hypothetical protein n=1 Tax=Aquamicrobium sp. TaxID=1872579 RepID=UPI00258B2515|nr:hypothetical protein [Aquamicrobium sp.]MCK9549228.1 hypothetical protein [Aquamicrobium sp.]